MDATGDAVDRLLLNEAQSRRPAAESVVVLDDASGALLEHYLGAGTPVRGYWDSYADREGGRVLAAAAGHDDAVHPALDAELLAGADLVLLRLPKSLAALESLATAVAALSGPDVLLLAAGRVKHMTRGMNDVLGRSFGSVTASLGQQKARALVATGPTPGATAAPTRRLHPDLSMTVVAYGGVFAGAGVDPGTRLLVEHSQEWPGDAATVVDLGSGTGVLAVTAARRCPTASVWAVDDSLDAVRSTMATAEANDLGARVRTRHRDRLDLPLGTVDLVVCNPPFHRGTARDSGPAFGMFADAARALRPGGELWTVYNSHLPYLPTLRRAVGSTQVVTQNRSYLVTRSTRS